jgi:hypothetical protein
MSQQELLTRVVDVLKQSGVDYMLTGSLVSSLQGDPRATHDIDFVVAMTVNGAASLLRAFPPPRFYLDEPAVLQAIAGRDMFNLLDADTGDKVDFWLLTDGEFDQSRFARKVAEDIEGFSVNVSKPEDTILMKLKWAEQSGGSERQLQDARSVYELQLPVLDQAYLDRWAQKLGLSPLLERLRNQAGPVAGGPGSP